jgi:hypothetical protein
MELESTDAKIADQSPRLAGAGLSLGGVDAGKRNQHVIVLGRKRRHLLVGIAAKPGLAFGVDRKDHRRNTAAAIVGRRLRHGRRMIKRRLKIGSHGRLEIVIAIVRMGAARFLRMGVKVDGDEVLDIKHGVTWLVGWE